MDNNHVTNGRYINVLIIALLVICHVTLTTAGNVGGCQLMAPCHCVLDNGQFLDLTSVGKSDGTAAFANVTDKHEMSYSWNPCYPFNSVCHDNAVAVCAIRPALPKDIYLDIGRHNSSLFQINPDRPGAMQLVYNSSANGETPIRTSRISLVCEANGTNIFTALGPRLQTSLIYEFEFRGPNACPQGQPVTTTTPSSGSPHSATTDIVIAVVSVAVVAAMVASLIILRKKGLICKKQNYESVE